MPFEAVHPVVAIDDPPAFLLSFPAEPTVVRAALAAARSRLCDRLNGDEIGVAELVLAEVINNVVEHAYPDHSPGRIELAVWPTETGLRCRVTDHGTALPRPDAHLNAEAPPLGPVEALPEGGFGWFLIRSLTTELRYERNGNRNRLSFMLPSTQAGWCDPSAR